MFIWLGGIGFCASLVAGAATFATGVYILAVAPVLIGVIGSASIVLVGGSTYVLCSIDSRLEALVRDGI